MPDQAMGVAMTSVPVRAASRMLALPRRLATGLLLASIAAFALPGATAADQNMTSLKLSGFGKNTPPPAAKGCNGPIAQPSLKQGGGTSVGQVDDLVVSTPCTIKFGGTYYYGQINIVGPNGSLTITEPASGNKNINIWASSIVIENKGKLIAGSEDAPYGSNGGTLTFYIYGEDASHGKDPSTNPGLGALCYGKLVSTGDNKSGPCGIPWSVWNDNGKTDALEMPGKGFIVKNKEVKIKDDFYQYGPLFGDYLCNNVGDKTQWTAKNNVLCGTYEDPRPRRTSTGRSAISATRCWAFPMAGLCSSSATRELRCPRHRRGTAATILAGMARMVGTSGWASN